MYADYTFYQNQYFGDVLTNDNANKWLDRASDYVDVITFHRLDKAFPTDEHDAMKVKKAVTAFGRPLPVTCGEVLKTDAALYPGQWMGGGEKSVEGAAGQIEISNVFRQPFRLYDKAGINVILVILKVFQQLRIAPVVNAQCDVRMGGGKFIQNRNGKRLCGKAVF